jgi:glyoxylase-like metal-dependent hydrolase (beta-lactamase superfamily II)
MHLGLKRAVLSVFGSAMAMFCATALGAPAPAAQARAEAAYQAMGGEKLQQVTSIVTKGAMQQWDPGESYSVADLTMPNGGTSSFVKTWDQTKGFARIEWVRPGAGGGNRTYTEIVMPDAGYVLGNDSNGAPTKRTIGGDMPARTMSGIRLTATLRELERDHIVFDMHDHPERVSDAPPQTIGGKTYPAVQFRADHGTFVVAFDPATKLPAVVGTRDFDQLMGDAYFDLTLSDWREVGGIKVPYRQIYTLNGLKIFDTTLTDVRVDAVFNSILPADTFAVPAALRGKAAPPAPIAQAPYQWILRRLASGFFLDSDNLYTDDGGVLSLTDVAPNVSMVTGSTHNTLIVATNTYLVAFDSPGDDVQSKIAIDLASKKYPGKPFRYLVLTHHHIDHSGGLRAYVAAGATLVVGKGDGEFFRKVLAAPQGLNVNRPQGAVTPRVIEVSGKWSVNDGGREIDAFSLDNPHASGYLIPYVPDAKLGFVTDLWNPGPPVMNVNPNMVAVVRGVEKMGIKPERFVGGHGAVGNYADLERAVQAGGAR